MSLNYKDEILKLKKEKNVKILAHYYQVGEIQEVADEIGDSYYLSKVARDCSENSIIFCGVKFMAESAKILSPHKKVFLPVMDAGCPMAEMADVDGVLKLKAEHPDALVVCYINSTTEVKALCDVSVTSSSAEKIFNNIKEEKIIFLPDRNLGGYLAEKFPEKEFILWNGFCITHVRVQKEHISELKEQHPNALILVHPECEKEIRELADFIGSTGDILKYSKESSNSEFIVVTEEGILHQMKKDSPNKKFYIPNGAMTCFNMKKTSLKDLYECLLNEKNEITIPEDLRVKALNSLNNMHKLAR